MARARVLALVTVAIVAAAVLVLCRGDETVAIAHGPSAPPSAAPDTFRIDEAPVTGESVRTSMDAPVEPRAAAEAANDGDDEPDTEIARGDVFGYVFGYRGEPLARHAVGVKGEDSGSWANRAQTDADGFYAIEGVPVGEWVVVYTGPVAYVREASSVPDIDPSQLERNDLVTANEDSRVRVGKVHIEPGRRTRFDVQLSGTKVLAGTFRLFNEEGANSLIVELRPEQTPERVAASAHAVYYADDPRSGYVRFTGLVPDVYLLRVCLDTVDPNHRPYVEWPVDLLEGDVDAGVRDFTISSGPDGLRFHEITDDDR
jgi:hypothetical protein